MKKIFFLILLSLIVFPVFSQPLWTIEHAIENYADGLILHRIPQNKDVAVIAFENPRRSIMEYFFETMQNKLWERGSNIWVYDRQRLEALQSQLNFSLTGSIDADTARRIGNFLYADVVIYGSLSRVGQVFRMNVWTVLVDTGQALFPRSYDIQIDSTLDYLLRQMDPLPVRNQVITPDENPDSEPVIEEEEIIATPMPSTPVREPRSSPEPWQNKWLYLRFSFDFPIFVLQTAREKITYPDPYDETNIKPEFRLSPGATIGLELQFLNWMSTELGFFFRHGLPLDPGALILGLGLQLKFPIKPSGLFMLEPYLLANGQFNTTSMYERIPPLAAGAGFQFALRGPAAGAFFADLNFQTNLDSVYSKNPREDWLPERFKWNRFAIGLGIGYKIGFFDR